MVYSYEGRVRFSEVDEHKKLSLAAVINYLQDTCVFHSESVDAGVDYISRSHRAWVLGAWRIEFLKDICYAQQIRVQTWPYGFKGFYGYRNFTIEDEQGNCCVRADSTWMLYSMKEERLAKITEDDIQCYPCEEPLQMERCERKLKMPGEGIQMDEIPVRQSYIDTNGHMNNSRYIQIALEAAQLTEPVAVLKAEYKKAAKYKDTLVPFVCRKDELVFVALQDKNGHVFANVEFTLRR